MISGKLEAKCYKMCRNHLSYTSTECCSNANIRYVIQANQKFVELYLIVVVFLYHFFALLFLLLLFLWSCFCLCGSTVVHML